MDWIGVEARGKKVGLPSYNFLHLTNHYPLSMTATSSSSISNSCLGPGHGRDYKVGTSVPANTPHAVSVSLPLWKDNIDYEEGRLKETMEIGYPRFFIHKMIQEVSRVII